MGVSTAFFRFMICQVGWKMFWRSAGNGGRPPLGLEFKLSKDGFSEAPKLRKFLEHLLGQILVKIFLVIWPPSDPLTPQKRGSFLKNTNLCVFRYLHCFSINKMVFLARNVGFRLFLALETLEQTKISCLKPKFSQVAQHDFRAFNLSLQSFWCYS